MIRIFSSNYQKFIKSAEKSEAELNRFLSSNWSVFFPHLIFIKSEFPLDGLVRSKGTSGRIDILSFNSRTNKFAIVELKRDNDKNIRSQAGDYKYFIESNFSEVYLSAKEDHNIDLPKRKDISKDNIELILIARNFSDLDIDLAKKSNGEITLIKYQWFENDLLLVDYLNNEPTGSNKNEKSTQPKQIIETKPLFEKPQIAKGSGERLVFESRRKGALAYGQKLDNGDFKVFADSTVSETEAPQFQKSNQKAFDIRRSYERDGTIVDRKFTTDVVFGSISLATSVIMGDSQNGQKWQ